MSAKHVALRKSLFWTCATIAFVVAAPKPSEAQERHEYNIERQDLETALLKFAQISGVDLIYSRELVSGKTTAGVTGLRSDEEVLKSLLVGTGLVVTKTSSGALVLKLAPIKVAAAISEPGPIVIAQATPPAPQQQAQAPATEEIVVTGTRIVRNGYDSPTPLTVISAESLQDSASANIADVMRAFPAFAGSTTPQSNFTSVSAQGAGLNLLNLRSLGANRTLILIDGQRSVAARVDGVVDINDVPQELVQRVDVVTGGASAIYGSDAITGVVNFVLDKTFTGIKGEVSGGVTTYGDDRSYKVSLTAGAPFANDRGHFLITGEIDNKDGVLDNHRPWNLSQIGVINNTPAAVAAGQPQRIVATGVDAWYTKGMTINAGPLKGIAFGPGGTPYQFNFGSLTDALYTEGGDSKLGEIRLDTGTLDPRENRQEAFTRVSYDLTDNINVFAQTSWNRTYDLNYAFPNFMLGNGPTVKSGDPFIPASVQAQMTALGVTSFTVQGFDYDLPFIAPQRDARTERYVLGGSGKFDAIGTPWTWNVYWQKGVTLINYSALGATRGALRAQAADAVRNPATGAIVCRSTLTNPNDGCVPWDPMGLGVNSQAAINFLTDGGDHPHTDQHIGQDVMDGSVTGEPFSSWAGPVSLALNVERRIEKAIAKPSVDTLAGDWLSGNFLPFTGRYSVIEGAGETVIPLAKNAPFAQSWDLSAAVRETSYSVSGEVTTWKFGTTYAPIDDIKVRATRSRDIRAPSLQDLYQTVLAGFNLAFDPFTNQSASVFLTQTGNSNLTPEKADTTDVGVVFQPRFLPGFSASVDYWNINLSNAIATPSLNQILTFCFQGLQAYCADITRTNGIVTAMTQTPVNIAVQITRGIDFEGSYALDMDQINSNWDGKAGLHVQATTYLKNLSNTGLAPPTDTTGENSGAAPPNWQLIGRLDYTTQDWSTSFTGRAMSSGTLHNYYVVCQSNCPTVVTPNQTINENYAPGYFYLDWSVSHFFNVGDSKVEAFLNITNLFNRDPGLIPKGSDEVGHEVSLTNPGKYDVLGRVFRAGVRFKM